MEHDTAAACVHSNRDEIIRLLTSVLGNCLATDSGEIGLQSRLIEDLGVDSLDLLDIIFKLEKSFSIRLRNTEIDKLLRGEISSEDDSTLEFIPEKDIERLAQYIPALRTVSDRNKVRPSALLSLVTVETLVIAIEEELGRVEIAD